MLVTQLSIAEGAGHNGANLCVRITHADLTSAVADTAETESILAYVPGGAAVAGGVNCNAKLLDVRLTQPFEDSTDSAFNDVQVTVGDSASATRFLAATQINRNGTEVTGATPTANAITAAATNLNAVFTPAGGKNLAALDKGILDLYFFVSFNAQ